jgi:MYXO-CTERM domain-containing protein
VKHVPWVLLFCALPAHAYKRTTNSANLCIWWQARSHTFQIDAQGTPDAPTAETYDAIRKSFQTWAAVQCTDLVLTEEPLSTKPADRLVGYFQNGSDHNLVLFRTRACRDFVPAGDACRSQGGCGNLYDCWDDAHGSGVIATTTTTTNRLTGEILDSDIELNDSPAATGTKFTFTTVDGLPCTTPGQTGCVRIDVQNTVTHEAGHTLGLDHTDNPSATMYASAPSGQTSKRILGSDDIAGICAIYPRGAQTVTCMQNATAPGGCGCSPGQSGPGSVLATLAVLLQIARRSRRRPQIAISASKNAASTALRVHGTRS